MSGHHDVLFPTDISWGSIGGPQFKTSVVTLPSGSEERVEVWSGGRLNYNARYGVKTPEQLARLQSFFRARRGAAYSFEFKDFLDYHSDPDNPTYVAAGVEGHTAGVQDQEIGVGDGSLTVFQLSKTYVSGLGEQIRSIFKPAAGTVRVWVNSVEQVLGVDFTVDLTTGLVTLTTAPTSGFIVDASFEFYVPVRFTTEAGEVLAVSIDAFNTGNAPDIPLIEVLDPTSGYQQEFFYGGSKDMSIAANAVLSIGHAHTYRIAATSSGLKVTLPPVASTPDGRPVFTVINDGSISFDVQDESAAIIVTLAAGTASLLSVIQTTAGGARAWLGV